MSGNKLVLKPVGNRPREKFWIRPCTHHASRVGALWLCRTPHCRTDWSRNRRTSPPRSPGSSRGIDSCTSHEPPAPRSSICSHRNNADEAVQRRARFESDSFDSLPQMKFNLSEVRLNPLDVRSNSFELRLNQKLK